MSSRLEGGSGERQEQSSPLQQNPMTFLFPQKHKGRSNSELPGHLSHRDALGPPLEHPLAGGWPQAAFGRSHSAGPSGRVPTTSLWQSLGFRNLILPGFALAVASGVLGVPPCGLPASSWGFLGSSPAASLLYWWDGKVQRVLSPFPFAGSCPSAMANSCVVC